MVLSVSCRRPGGDVTAAKAFFRKAIKSQQCAPQTITLVGYAASHRAAREMKADGPLPADTKLRSSKYLADAFGIRLLVTPICPTP
jgi:transposase-like protein